jgi:hypothetical protein
MFEKINVFLKKKKNFQKFSKNVWEQKNFIIKHKLTFIEFKEFIQSLCLYLSIFVSNGHSDGVDKGLKVQM